MVEALSAGIDVLVSDIDGLSEIAKKTGFGYTFKSGDINECALKICEIYSNRNNMESQVQFELQRQVCKKYFDVENTAKSYLDEYKKMVLI